MHAQAIDPPSAAAEGPLAEQVMSAAAEPATASRQYLTFLLAGQSHAIGILAIREIIELPMLTPVPMMPPCVLGVINLRGAVVPVVDLQARLGRPPAETTRRSCVVIVEVAEAERPQVVGVVVDSVSEVVEIADERIERPPSFGARIRGEFIAGMARVHDDFVTLLDVDRTLAVADIGALPRVH